MIIMIDIIAIYYIMIVKLASYLVFSTRIVLTLIDINTFTVLILKAVGTFALFGFPVLDEGIQAVAYVTSCSKLAVLVIIILLK